METKTFDFVVVGSGFGGSIMSMVLRQLGQSVLLLERGAHPRFAIGESSTPFANLLLEKIADEFDLPFLRSLAEWGSWQRDFPELPAGLKRGFTFYHHTPGQPLDLADHRTQLLVAASPNDRVADTHWYRPDFDAFLVARARELGVVYCERAEMQDLVNQPGGWEFAVQTKERFRARARFLIDATGHNGFGNCGAETLPCPFMPPTAGVYAHFRDVPRLDDPLAGLRNACTYPPDDAAVHHIFEGGWIWLLRFNNEIISAGAALERTAGFDLNLPPESLWRSILGRFPTLQKLFAQARPVTPFYFSPQLAFRRARAAGRNWAALPSAAGFVDPLLSTGFALNLLGVLRLGRCFAASDFDFSTYETETFRELEAAADLVSALYAKMDHFEEFALLSLLYFAALSFTETAWRVDKPELASGFLLTNDPRFASVRAELCARARAGFTITREAISDAIGPYDIAGLTDWSRYPRYPVKFEDLSANAHKLNASPASLDRLFRKLGVLPRAQLA